MTDSPQVAQVYVHNTRIPAHSHYDVTGRAPSTAGPPTTFYDPARQIALEPPPAHRSAPAHSVVAPPSVVVPHPSTASSSPFMAAAPPATAVQPVPMPGAPAAMHHPKQMIDREREQREREREQQIMREKEQILVRAGKSKYSLKKDQFLTKTLLHITLFCRRQSQHAGGIYTVILYTSIATSTSCSRTSPAASGLIAHFTPKISCHVARFVGFKDRPGSCTNAFRIWKSPCCKGVIAM